MKIQVIQKQNLEINEQQQVEVTINLLQTRIESSLNNLHLSRIEINEDKIGYEERAHSGEYFKAIRNVTEEDKAILLILKLFKEP